jgi:aldehyde dehydrogenase (NAD(P)+)
VNAYLNQSKLQQLAHKDIDYQLTVLAGNKTAWVNTSVAERIKILQDIKLCLLPVSKAWATMAARKKGIPDGSHLIGEEWMSGPYTLMSYCNQMIATLTDVVGKEHLKGLPLRQLPNGQISARVLPNSIWDHLLLSGVSVDVWMEPGVTRNNLVRHTASIYDPTSPNHKQGKVAVVLGAGNIAAIAPLDVFQKLFSENQVVVLKMNPVNDYLIEFLEPALKPLIDRGVLSIVRGDIVVGGYLCKHPLVEEIHITGSGSAYDEIIWGTGSKAIANKLANTPTNTRRITAELGAVCPTIVIPGPWSKADIAFQAEQVATQKLHNSGFNCVACQVLIMSKEWLQKNAFTDQLEKVISASSPRALYYPGTKQRLASFMANNPKFKSLLRKDATPVIMSNIEPENSSYAESTEVFAPALSVTELGGSSPEAFLKLAIEYANKQLYGTLGANIVIHPKTIEGMGRKRFEELLSELHYGTIAINTWTGIGFFTPQATWGAFPGHSLADAQSGIGLVHNSMLFDKPQRTVVEAPFKPFPRNLMSFSFTLLPKPPWFITHRKGNIMGRLMVHFQYKPSFFKIPRIFLNAMLG